MLVIANVLVWALILLILKVPLKSGARIASRVVIERRASAYLSRILVLTRATLTNDSYSLTVGTMQFQIHDRFVRRTQNPKDPGSEIEETCFYLAHCAMPKAEKIATVLLQLSNNPGLFDKWAIQNGVAFKADGQAIGRLQ